MKKSTIAVVVIVAVVLIGGLVYWSASQSPAQPQPAAVNTSPSGGTAANSAASTSASTSVTTGAATSGTAKTSTAVFAPAPAKATITYTDSGFSPKTLTVAQGTIVTFKNAASDSFWPASNVHPVHSAYDGTTLQEHCANPTPTTFDACGGIAPGGSWSFTFNKLGTWAYHNHLNPSEGGTVIVK